MKTSTRFFVAFAALATGVHAAPFLAAGDNAEIFLTGTLGVRADSNIFLSPTNESDVIADITPGVEFVFGKSSAVQGKFTFADNISRYMDHSDLDTNLVSTAFQTGYSNGKSKLGVDASFTELNQNTVDVRPATQGGGSADALIRRDMFTGGGSGEVAATEKTSIGAGVRYNKTNYKRPGLSDVDQVTVPVNYYYELTPKVDLSLGYRYRRNWQQIGLDSTDHFFNVGARGEFTPKLSGQLNVGVTQRQFSGGSVSDQSLLGIDSSLAYTLSPKVTLQLVVNNDFDANSQGQQQKNLMVQIGASARISEEWTISAGGAYRSIDYYRSGAESRVDDFFQGQFGVTYVVSENINVTGNLSYLRNQSRLTLADFEGSVVSLAANFRY